MIPASATDADSQVKRHGHFVIWGKLIPVNTKNLLKA